LVVQEVHRGPSSQEDSIYTASTVYHLQTPGEKSWEVYMRHDVKKYTYLPIYRNELSKKGKARGAGAKKYQARGCRVVPP